MTSTEMLNEPDESAQAKSAVPQPPSPKSDEEWQLLPELSDSFPDVTQRKRKLTENMPPVI